MATTRHTGKQSRVIDDGMPRLATVPELLEAKAIIARHALALMERVTLDGAAPEVALLAGFYTAAALTLQAALRKEHAGTRIDLSTFGLGAPDVRRNESNG
jgi:hypothetical protein